MKGCRHGNRDRQITGTFGTETISVPRARIADEAGKVTLAWLGRCRRLSKDWEKSIASAEAWVIIAHLRRITRHLARH